MHSALLLLLAAAPATSTWNARVVARNPGASDKPPTAVVYEARALAADTESCKDPAKPTLRLLGEGCDDEASGRRLAALAKEAGPAKVLATPSPGADGRFQANVPKGRLYVHVESGSSFEGYVVEPVAGVETRLEPTYDTSRDAFQRRLFEVIDRGAVDDADSNEVWVLGQDNPQVLHLAKDDLALLSKGKLGTPLLGSCSKVVSATGRVLGSTCSGDERKTLDPMTFVLKGRVTANGTPRAKLEVRVLLGDGALTARTDAAGRFEVEVTTSVAGVLVVADDGILSAAEPVELPSPLDERRPRPRAVELRLAKQEVLRLRVERPKGLPAAGATVRARQRGGHLVTQLSDARGEVVLPASMRRSFLSVSLPGHRRFHQFIDLARQPVVTVVEAKRVAVSFRTADGVLLINPIIRCSECLDVEQPLSRDGLVRLVLEREAAAVSVNVEPRPIQVSRDGVYLLEPPSAPVPVTVGGPNGELTNASWSTPSGKPEPGRQWVRACLEKGCVLQEVDVRPGAVVTLAEPPMTTLEIRTRNPLPGAPMPSSVTVRGPGLADEREAYFDADGVAKVKVAHGLWSVGYDLDTQNPAPRVWCSTDASCELDLAKGRPPRVQLSGAVPREVNVMTPTTWGDGRSEPVVDGGIDGSLVGPIFVEGTTRVPADGGTQFVKLAPPATVQVRVTDPAGKPVRGASVSWGLAGAGRWLGDRARLATTDERGRASFAKVRPGNVPLRVASPGFALASTPGVALKNEVRLEPGHDVKCRVANLPATHGFHCTVEIDGAVADELRGAFDEVLLLTDLPARPVKVGAVVFDGERATWMLEREVDPSREPEVVFDFPRAGTRLVLPLGGAEVRLGKLGTAVCAPLGSPDFCETPPLPPGEAVVYARRQGEQKLEWTVQVPATGGRVLSPLPKGHP